MVYFEVSMTCSEIYTKRVGLLKTLLLSPVASSAGLKTLIPAVVRVVLAWIVWGFAQAANMYLHLGFFSFEKCKNYNNSRNHIFCELQF